MSSVVVEFLLQNILQFITYRTELIKDVKDDMEDLEKDLKLFQAYLREMTQWPDLGLVREMANQIRQVTYKAEDAVEAYVCEASVKRTKLPLTSKFLSVFMQLPNLVNMAEEIKRIKKQMDTIHVKSLPMARTAIEAGSSHNRTPEEKKDPVIEEEYVVGFDGEAANIIRMLTEGSPELKIVTIVGMPGLGKTTLANKVYKDRDIGFKFVFRSWVYVSKSYTRSEVFLKILRDLCGGRLDNEMYRMDAFELATELRRRLEEHRYLIVMDDVWTKDAWNELQTAFPRNKKGSRIVITTREREVGVAAQLDGIYNLRFLEENECLELLRWKVFRENKFPKYLECFGKTIAKECGGLPLAVVIIAGILKQNVDDTYWWSDIAKKVTGMVVKEEEQCKKVVRWSYDNLADNLKLCFLYFGVFPEDYEVPARKLMLLWIAEGFVEDHKEETAVQYLQKLVDKSLVKVDKRAADGRIKTCSVHDMMHELCEDLAKEENIFNVITDPEDYMSSGTDVVHSCRRLCLHSGISNFIKAKPSAARVRSFLSMPAEDMKLPKEHTAFIPRAFQLLRVLDVESIIFEQFPREIVALVLLRYIAMSVNFDYLPLEIAKLWNLQILVIRVTKKGTLQIKADVWEMRRLSYLQTNVPVNFTVRPKTKADDDEFPSQMKVITSLTTQSCSKEVLAKIRNVKELGIHGNLAEFLDVEQKDGSFEALAGMSDMQTLHLHNDLSSGQKIRALPCFNKFPSHLKRVTISNTKLDWNHMATLAMLPSLMVLKLKENAFIGEYWNVGFTHAAVTESEMECFPRLEVLHIKKTDLKKWEAIGDYFPCLKRLSVKYCACLEAIPSGLAESKELSNMQIIKVKRTNVNVAASARELEHRLKERNKDSRLHVSIFPPTDDPHQKSSDI